MKQPLLPWISRMSHQKEPDWVSSLCYSPLIYSLCWCTWNMNGTLSYARCHPLSRIAGASKWCHGCKFWGKHTWRGWYFVLKHYFFFTEEINNVTFFFIILPLALLHTFCNSLYNNHLQLLKMICVTSCTSKWQFDIQISFPVWMKSSSFMETLSNRPENTDMRPTI